MFCDQKGALGATTMQPRLLLRATLVDFGPGWRAMASLASMQSGLSLTTLSKAKILYSNRSTAAVAVAVENLRQRRTLVGQKRAHCGTARLHTLHEQTSGHTASLGGANGNDAAKTNSSKCHRGTKQGGTAVVVYDVFRGEVTNKKIKKVPSFNLGLELSCAVPRCQAIVSHSTS